MYCVHYDNTEEIQQKLELWTDSLNLGDEFKVHNPSNVGKKEGENTPVAFGIGQYRLKTASLWIVTGDPALINSNDPWHEKLG